MTPRVFYEKVKELRKVQKEYFKTRNPSALSISRHLEDEIDAEIERVEAIVKKNAPAQGKLNFG